MSQQYISSGVPALQNTPSEQPSKEYLSQWEEHALSEVQIKEWNEQEWNQLLQEHF